MRIPRLHQIFRRLSQYLRMPQKTFERLSLKPLLHGAYKRDIKGLPENLSRISGSLLKESRESEKDFSSLGNDLLGLHQEISELMEIIKEAAISLGSGDDKGLMAETERMTSRVLLELDSYKKSLKESSSDACAIRNGMRKLSIICKEFEKTAFFFRSVGINIRIESSRARSASDMFGFLSEEIRPISEKILEILEKIHQDLEDAGKALKESEKMISSGLSKFDKISEKAEETFKSTVMDLDKIVHFSRNILDQAGENSRTISSKTGEVVMQVQFHDSMRQRIEHMAHALDDAEKKIIEALSKDDEAEGRDQSLGSAFSIIRLQKAQIEDLGQELGKVLLKTGSAFEEIRKNIDSLTGSLGMLERDESNDPFQKLKKSFLELSLLMNESKALSVHINASTSHAVSTAKRLNCHMAEIERINSGIHLIALNSIIKAAHLGEEGITLEELAQTLVRLSKATGEIVSEVNENISITNELIYRLCSSSEKAEERNSDSFEKASYLMEETYETFRINSSMAIKKAESINQSLSKAVTSLSFMAKLSSDFGTIGLELGRNEESLKALGLSDEPMITKEASELSNLYTMDKEREIHQRIIEGEANPHETAMDEIANIELFDIDEGNKEKEDPEQNKKENRESENLGDNIELF